ncbi:MAG: hemerythrin family protein [Candidatus Heimdallarchaeota archaeon]|nr:hemerythrin family protein [Candidatus Heimdallarchaeota archaeon]
MVEWSSRLETGIENIDAQHKGLVDTLNDLMKKTKEGTGKDEIEKMLDYLAEYTEKHFRDEEAIMEKYNYPQIDHHKTLHRQFEDEVTELIKDYVFSGGGADLLVKLNSRTMKWLIDHIMGIDQQLAKFLKTKM